MRLAPHVSSQDALRPGRSALRFSQPRLRQTGGRSALRFSQPRTAQAAMPGRKKSPSGLTERLDVRVAPGEKAEIRAIAKAAGLAVSELVRLRVLGRPVVGRTDATTIRELRRLGGLLKMVHLDSGGAYSEQTGAALGELRAAIGRVAGEEPGGRR
jgi:16S rRNA U516 pseudouridylate synthase RsuA-like enzyme